MTAYSYYSIIYKSKVSQHSSAVERSFHKRMVAGSNPAADTRLRNLTGKNYSIKYSYHESISD